MAKQTEEFIRRAYSLFDEFYAAAAERRARYRGNEELFRTNHWYDTPKKEEGEPMPVTPVLFSTLENLLSDIMDSYPDAVVLPEEAGDTGVAKTVGSVLKYVLKRRNYRSVYRAKCRSALKFGTSVQEVFWDRRLYGGLGDVSVREWDIRKFLCDPKCGDFQEGRAVFKYGSFTKEYFRERWQGAWEKMASDRVQEEGTADTAMLIEYWYKKRDKNGRTSVHMAKLAGGVLLERSEDSAPEGMYAHGRYPFIVEPLYAIEGETMGLGLIDVLKNLQRYADKLDQIILKNALMSGKARLLVNRGADLDERALLDWSKEVVRGSRIDDGAVRWFQTAPLSPYVLTHFNAKLAAIKEESGQNQFVRGETLKGVTAASAIMALQEAGSKRSRLIIEQLYDGFEELCRMVIEVMRENYTERRSVLIGGEEVALSSRELFKNALDLKRPIEFDIRVMVEKQSPYRTAYQNEYALQLLSAGVITKAEAVEMMTFEGKEKIAESVKMREGLM